MIKQHRPWQSRRWVLLLSVCLLLLVIVAVAVSFKTSVGRRPAVTQKPVIPRVTVLEVETASYQAAIKAYGEVTAAYELSLTAKVSGYVERLAPGFATGSEIEKGQVLLRLEDSDYRGAVASARQQLANTELSLLEEQRQAEQSRAEWESVGLEGAPGSPLVLRKPYVEAAEAALASAKAQLESAQLDLAHTQIVAPFNALVIERQVAPGSFVQSGAELGTLYSSDRMEIMLSLSAQDWSSLPGPEQLLASGQVVKLDSVDGVGHWSAYIARLEHHLDKETRQRALIVAVDDPLSQTVPLLPGSFVVAEIPGREVSGLWQLPNSALSQRGEIWYVTTDKTLDRFSATPLFGSGDFIYVKPPEALATQTQQILEHPLSSYLQGMRVEPLMAAVEGGDDE